MTPASLLRFPADRCRPSDGLPELDPFLAVPRGHRRYLVDQHEAARAAFLRVWEAATTRGAAAEEEPEP